MPTPNLSNADKNHRLSDRLQRFQFARDSFDSIFLHDYICVPNMASTLWSTSSRKEVVVGQMGTAD
jgi:hypothetical protein